MLFEHNLTGKAHHFQNCIIHLNLRVNAEDKSSNQLGLRLLTSAQVTAIEEIVIWSKCNSSKMKLSNFK